MTTNYKKPSESEYAMALFRAPDEWTIWCPIKQFCIVRGMAIEESKGLVPSDHILIDARVRHPKEVANRFVQIKITKKTDELIDNRDPDGPAIGEFTFIAGGDDIVEEDSFHVRQSVHPDLFEAITTTMLDKERIPSLRQEVELTVIGLLNDWDKSGYLRVTRFNLVSALFEQKDEK